MTAPAPATVDLLEEVIARVRPLLVDGPTKQRVCILWGAVKIARDLGAVDVVHAAFMALAVEVKLIDQRGYWMPNDVRKSIRRHGRQDIAHVVDWGLLGVNPFEKGPRQ